MMKISVSVAREQTGYEMIFWKPLRITERKEFIHVVHIRVKDGTNWTEFVLAVLVRYSRTTFSKVFFYYVHY